MEIASLGYITFSLFFLIIYWMASFKLRPLILLIASILFYLSLDTSFGFTIFFVLIITYSLGLILEKNKSRLLLTLGILLVIGTLILFKYLPDWNFLIVKLFNISIFNNNFNKYVLPIGLSFYSFQAISYLIDIFNKKIKPEKNIINFSLFLIYFPKVIAGPIERAENFISQLKISKKISYPKIISGILLFTIGAYKKLVIADNLAVIVNRVFSNQDGYKGLSLIITMVLYSWQIYSDFSGYTDMARGISRMFGIELLENFNFPYISKSIREFWRRWHISLSNWLKDYLYFPLGGNKKGFVRTLINVAIVFTICGIWHGASMMFVIWGFYHATVLIIERIILKFSNFNLNNIKSVPKIIKNTLGISYSFTVVTISWILFRSSSMTQAIYVFKNMFVGASNFIKPRYVIDTLSWLFEYNFVELTLTTLIFFTAILIDVLLYKRKLQKFFYKQPIIIKILFYSLIVSTILIFRRSEITHFIYVTF